MLLARLEMTYVQIQMESNVALPQEEIQCWHYFFFLQSTRTTQAPASQHHVTVTAQPGGAGTLDRQARATPLVLNNNSSQRHTHHLSYWEANLLFLTEWSATLTSNNLAVVGHSSLKALTA